MKKVKKRSSFRGFFTAHKAIVIVIALLLLERLLALASLGFTYSLESDDVSYIQSGITFANTGMITMHEPNYPSAQIMPGMTVFIGLLSFVFGEGTALWAVLKLVWIAMGSITAWFIYKSVCIFAPKWCGVLASLFLFRMDCVWMDNLILTETPFILFFTALIYCTLMMGKTHKRIYYIGCVIFYMLALMLKANIGPYPAFALIYLLIVKYDFKTLIKQGLILCVSLLCFIVPWSIRNYIQFDAFIPLTYGAGNPQLLGTYQGYGYPEDEALDYVTNVDEVTRITYDKYYTQDGNIKEGFERYVSLGADKIKAEYRLEEWKKSNPKSLFLSYAVIKPFKMITSVFYWNELFTVKTDAMIQLQIFAFILCICTVLSSLILKKYRAQTLFLTALYLGNLYIYAMVFAFERYHVSLMPIWYILIGIGCSLFVTMFSKAAEEVKKFEKQEKI